MEAWAANCVLSPLRLAVMAAMDIMAREDELLATDPWAEVEVKVTEEEPPAADEYGIEDEPEAAPLRECFRTDFSIRLCFSLEKSRLRRS